MTKRFLSRRYLFAVVILVPIWAYFLYFAITENPIDSQEKMVRMRADIENLLAVGGRVIEREENAKYGGAYISLVMSDIGWSAELMEKYEAALLRGGWVKRTDLNAYCFNGMKIEIKRHAGMRDQSTVNYIAAMYNAQTLKECGR